MELESYEDETEVDRASCKSIPQLKIEIRRTKIHKINSIESNDIKSLQNQLHRLSNIKRILINPQTQNLMSFVKSKLTGITKSNKLQSNSNYSFQITIIAVNAHM